MSKEIYTLTVEVQRSTAGKVSVVSVHGQHNIPRDARRTLSGALEVGERYEWEEAQGGSYPYGSMTAQITDEEAGGVIAYCHTSKAPAIVDALNKSEECEHGFHPTSCGHCNIGVPEPTTEPVGSSWEKCTGCGALMTHTPHCPTKPY